MNILIAGVGGQGTLLASKVLGQYAISQKLDCKLSEVHGMAQRGGSVVTFVRMGKQINSPIIDIGSVDYIIAFEQLEALRYAHYLKKDGQILYSSQKIMPMPVVSGIAKYPTEIDKKLNKAKQIDAMALAVQAGNIRTANSVMLGAFTVLVGLDKDKMLKALSTSVPAKTLDVNVAAFELGYNS